MIYYYRAPVYVHKAVRRTATHVANFRNDVGLYIILRVVEKEIEKRFNRKRKRFDNLRYPPRCVY